MESWSYVSSERGFVSEDSVTASVVIARGRNGSTDWEFKTPCYGSNDIGLESSNQDDIEDMKILDLGLQETMRKSVSNGLLDDKLSGVRMFSSSTENAFLEEESSNSKLSSSIMEFNCADSSLIDLKLGRFDDQKDAQKSSTSQVASDVYSTDSSSKMGKRIRVGVMNSLTPYCQVFGCKKDLSSCKDYHKRHKVCEVHSKTPKVIVNDIEQRFCQQCSRFHLLVEFDDGKRSCRKRLAGHNERRRKPHAGRSGRLYHTYSSGSRFQVTAVPTSSYNRQDVVPVCLSQQQRYERNNLFKHIKLEEGAGYSSQSTITVADGGLHLNSPFPYYGLDKNCPSIERNEGHDNSMNKSNGNSDQFMFRSASFGGETFTGFDSTSTVEALSGFSNSDRALSLLSYGSQASTNHTSNILGAYPLIISGSHEPYSVTQASENEISNKFISAGINSFENHFDQVFAASSGCADVNYGIDGMFHGSDHMNVKQHLSRKDEPTIDLLQLSSKLQQVEDQRQSLHEKPRDVAFW